LKSFRDYEKWIDDIRDQLYREEQELGKEEFERRQAKVVQEIVEQYGLTYANLPSARRAI